MNSENKLSHRTGKNVRNYEIECIQFIVVIEQLGELREYFNNSNLKIVSRSENLNESY